VVAANCTVECNAWRSVESQQKVATLSLVGGDPEQQSLLEEFLETAKPPVPAGVQVGDLHYLLYSPFRYAASASGTRFGAPHTCGIFYCADDKETALAETAYWKTRFAKASAGLQGVGQTVQRTLFEVSIAGPAVDLRLEPFNDDPSIWMHPTDYRATWQIGRQVRANKTIDMVRYQSVRDTTHRCCTAIFNPKAFTCTKPLQQEEWTLFVQGDHATFSRASETHHFKFAEAE